MSEMEIDLFEIVKILKKHLVEIIIIALLFAGVGAVYCYVISSSVYQSTAHLYVYS